MSRNNQLDRIVGKAEALQTTYPAALTQLARIHTILDGYPAGTDNPRVTGGGDDLTSVERAAQHRIGINDNGETSGGRAEVDYLKSLINAAELALDTARKETTRILGTRTVVPRCTAIGRDGAIEWGRPDCWDMPARGPLCAACYHRERRWRQDHGLPTREDAA